MGYSHEIEPDGTGKVMTPYQTRYAMPEVAPVVHGTSYFQETSQKGMDCTPSAFTGSYDYGNSFYSFDLGDI